MSGGCRLGFATLTLMLVATTAAVAFAALGDRDRGYVQQSHRRGPKGGHQRQSVRSSSSGSDAAQEPAVAGQDGGDDDQGAAAAMNVCSLEQRTTINLFCYCDDPTLYAATSADCWVFNDGEPQESPVWRGFRSQPNVTRLTFNVRGSTAHTLGYVPTNALAQLPELKTLEIVYANIHTVHAHAFANLSRLQDLALGRNGIVRLAGGSMANMADLRVVTLGDNAIDGISNDVFARLPALRKLYMDRNNISYVAEGAFEQLRRLEELDLNENRLSGSLSRYVFLGLGALRRLDMRANRLERVGPDAFAELVSLEELVLEDNRLRAVDGRGFAGLAALQRLTLANNRLTALDDRTFRGLDRLKFLDVRSNRLHTLTFATVQPVWDRLQNTSFYFYVQGNAFHCDCGLLWMNQVAAETTNEQVHRELSEAKCSMNDTAGDEDGPGGGLGDEGYGPGGGGSAQRKSYGGESGGTVGSGRGGGSDVPGVAAGGLGVYGGGGDDGGADNGGGGGGGGGDDKMKSAADAMDAAGAVRTFDEFYDKPPGDSQPLTLVSSLDENTCPGKEQPLVDGAPDAAQNSDRVLWESNKSSGGGGGGTGVGAAPVSGTSAYTPLLLLMSLLLGPRIM